MNIKPAQIEFLEDGHTYKHKNGTLYTGVTTILGVRNKDFLKWWTVKEMYNFLLDKQPAICGADENEYIKILEEGKKAHTKKSKEALVSGKIAHDWIEEYVKAKIKGEDADKQFPDDQKAASSIHSFLDWHDSHEIEWIASELVVASEEHQFAGTLDGLAKVDGTLTIVDFKTSSQISEEYFLQTAGYYLALKEMADIQEPIQRLILRIPKDGKDFEAMIVPTDLEFDCKTFINLRNTHRWNVYIQNHFTGDNGKLK